MNKPHLEFQRLDLSSGWSTPDGYPAGIQQKILASDIDERRKVGTGHGFSVSIPVFTPSSRSFTITGRRCTFSQAI